MNLCYETLCINYKCIVRKRKLLKTFNLTDAFPCQAENINDDIATRYILKTARQDFTANKGWTVRNTLHNVLALKCRTAVVNVLPKDHLRKINSKPAPCK